MIRNTPPRNYQIDCLKLIFSFIVLLFHSAWLGDGYYNYPLMMGQVSTHFFFVVSGMLMTDSIVRHGSTDSPERAAIMLCIQRIKPLIFPLWISILFIIIAENILNGTIPNVFFTIAHILPECFLLTRTGLRVDINPPVWYLSAMYLSMLPLSYLLFKKNHFTLYIFAPLISVHLFGYLCYANDFSFEGTYFSYVVMFEIVRAVCGLSFGICAWVLSQKIQKIAQKYYIHFWLAIMEVLLYFLYFYVWFLAQENVLIMSVQLVLPIMLAITFSGESRLSHIFTFSWMKYFAPLSRSIYLNHWVANIIVAKLFADKNYLFCLATLICITLASCLLNYFLVFCIQKCMVSLKIKYLKR